MSFHTSRASLGRAALTLASASIKRPPLLFGFGAGAGLAATGLAATLAFAAGLAALAFGFATVLRFATAAFVLANRASTSAFSAFADTPLGLPLLIKIILISQVLKL
jgi:hypothetical protein